MVVLAVFVNAHLFTPYAGCSVSVDALAPVGNMAALRSRLNMDAAAAAALGCRHEAHGA